MPSIILFNKPFQVLSQFTDDNGRSTLKDFLSNKPGFYVAGRLDYDSEGLLILTDHGPLQHYISHPKFDKKKTYWVQVEGDISDESIAQLENGIVLKDGKTKPSQAKRITAPVNLWPRVPPIRERKAIPTSWISLTLGEGKNRQVRRMTAAVGYPTLRIIRASIGDWSLEQLAPGEFSQINIDMPILPASLTLKKPNADATRHKPRHKVRNTGNRNRAADRARRSAANSITPNKQ